MKISTLLLLMIIFTVLNSPNYSTVHSLDHNVALEIQDNPNAVQPHIKDLKEEIRALSPQYTPATPILIVGDQNFHDTMVARGWTGQGDGSSTDPYIIKDLSITGASEAIKIVDTTVHFQINGCYLAEGNRGILLENVTHGVLSHNTIFNTSWGIYLRESTHNEISNNTISRNSGGGMYLMASNTTHISDNLVANNTGMGINLSESKNITISGNTLFNNSNRGIELSGSENNTLSNNIASHNGGTGINVGWESRNNTVLGNTAMDNAGYGIGVGQKADNCTVTDNIAANNTRRGIYLDRAGDSTVENNTATNNGEDGIGFSNSENCRVVNNTIANSQRYGISLSGSANNTILRNTLTNNGFYIYGSELAYYFQTAMTDNTVNGKPVLIWENIIGGTVPEGQTQIILVNCTGVEVTGQTLSSASVGILAAFSSQLVIHNNFIFDNYAGIQLRSAVRVDCSKNTLSDNNSGLRFEYSSGNSTIKDNVITNSDIYGLYLRRSGNNTIENNFFTNSGIHISGEELSHYLQATVKDNTVNGKPLLYWENSTDGRVPSGVGQVILVNSPDVVVDGQTLTDTSVGVVAAFSSNLTVFNTTFGKNYLAIELWNCSNFNISQNTIFDSGSYSAYIQHSENGLLTNNRIANSTRYGIYLYHSGSSRLSANAIAQTMTGVYAQYSENSSFSDNLVANSAQYGISLAYCGNDTLAANTVTNSSKYGIFISNSDNTSISGNVVSNAVERGIYLSSADNSTCSDNVISNNAGYGLFLIANNINVTDNSFYGNNPGGTPQGTSQAYDAGNNNNISRNFWDDWTSPDDSPPDGIVDDPYSIDGAKHNEDAHPLTVPATTHRLSPAVIWNPLRGEILSGIATIQWTPAVDTRDYSVAYNISYSADAGATWTELATGLTSTSYPWNTSTVSDGKAFQVKVMASGGQGLTQEAVSKGTFSIRNAPHTLSSPTLSYPAGGETVNGTITIQWAAAIDSWTEAWGDTVTYSVYYGTVPIIAWGMTAPIPNWIKLATGLTTTSLEWDTTAVADGGNYLIKVVAQCSEGLTAEATIASTFTIDNVPEGLSSEEPSSEELGAEEAPVAVIVVAGAVMLLVAGTLLIRRRRRRRRRK